MKTVFFGTPKYATCSIRALLDAGVDIPLICTRPARRTGRGQVHTASPVAAAAQELGISVITPERLDKKAIDEIRNVDADTFAVVAYGRLIPKDMLQIPRLGVLNIHPSLLPKHRGPSPVATAILNGDTTTGVSIMLLDEGMDTGPILAQSAPIAIENHHRCDALTERLFEIGSEMLPAALEDLASGTVMPAAQNHAAATSTRLIKKEDGLIDWQLPAEKILRMNRAYHPWPGTSTSWNGSLLKVIDAEYADPTSSPVHRPSGIIFTDSNGNICVAAGYGTSLQLATLQAAGRKAMPARDFVAGRPDFIGSQLGT